MTAYRFIQANRDQHTAKETAGLLGFNRSAYYQWARGRKPNLRGQADAEPKRLIREIATRHRRRHGSPRARRELRQTCGKRASLKKAARLTRENSLNARRRRKYIPTTDSRHALPACENILNREFTAAAAGQKRVLDIAYLRTYSGRIYLTAVPDLSGRKAVGRAPSDGMEAAAAAVSALRMALLTAPLKTGDISFRPWRSVLRPGLSGYFA